MRTMFKEWLIMIFLFRTGVAEPPTACPNKWQIGRQNTSTNLSQSWFCFISAPFDTNPCINLKAFVTDIRDVGDNLFITKLLQRTHNQAKNFSLLLSFHYQYVAIGLKSRSTGYFWNDGCLNPTITYSNFPAASNRTTADFYVINQDGSWSPMNKNQVGQTVTFLCRYDTNPCARYSTQCTNKQVCYANNSCYTCQVSTTFTTKLSTASTTKLSTTSTIKLSTTTTTKLSTTFTTNISTTTTTDTGPTTLSDESIQDDPDTIGFNRRGFFVILGLIIAVLVFVFIVLTLKIVTMIKKK